MTLTVEKVDLHTKAVPKVLKRSAIAGLSICLHFYVDLFQLIN